MAHKKLYHIFVEKSTHAHKYSLFSYYEKKRIVTCAFLLIFQFIHNVLTKNEIMV